MLNLLKKLLKTNNGFVSDAEKFLIAFDKTHSRKSDSQLREIAKYERVSHLRDHAVKDNDKNKIWEGF